MPFDPDASDLTVAVIGTGTMGRGIVQVSAQGGMRVIAYDEKPGAAQAAKDYIAKTLSGLVEKGRVPEADAKAAIDRIVVAKDMGDVGKAKVVIEAIVEQLDRQAGAVCQAGSGGGAGGDPGVEHVVDPDHRDRLAAASIPSASAACTSSIRCR